MYKSHDGVTLAPNTLGAKRLMLFKLFIDEWKMEHKAFRYDVVIQDMYLDYGANMMWTAPLTIDNDREENDVCREWQSFCPRDWELIVNCDSIQQLHDMAYYYTEKLNGGEWSWRQSLYEIFE